MLHSYLSVSAELLVSYGSPLRATEIAVDVALLTVSGARATRTRPITASAVWTSEHFGQ